MLIKVFRENLKLEAENEALEVVFHSIEDITELTVNLIGQLEDTIEMTESNQVPLVGTCFLELAEVNIQLKLIIISLFGMQCSMFNVNS